MITHDFEQGSDAWLAHRGACWNAGDAAAMLSCSPNETRDELLARLHSGVHKEFSDYVQARVIDPGYRFEDNARVLAEQLIGEDLGRVVGSLEVGLSRPLGASFDGLTFMNDKPWEHKRLNAALREAFAAIDAGASVHEALPKAYRVQMEQQQMVASEEATQSLFMASEWNADGTLKEERHCWYDSDPALRAEIIPGWRQLEADLAAFVPSTVSEKVVAEPVEYLPAPVVTVTGELSLKDNFKEVEVRLRSFLDHKLIRQPKTDQDFVDLDAQIKAMKQGREDLKAAKSQMLAQVQPIDQAAKTADMLDALLQQNCSMAERLLKDEKERRKGEVVADGVKAFDHHIKALNDRLGKPYMPKIPTDFGGVIRGLKSLTSMEGKVNDELARAKIAANEVADKIDANLKFLRENAAQHTFLFVDAGTIVLKAADDLQTLVRARIAEHDRAEAARLEAEREKIRAEEQAKVERGHAAKVEAERRERESAEAAQAARVRAEEVEAQRQEQERQRAAAAEIESAAAEARAGLEAARETEAMPKVLLDELSTTVETIASDSAARQAISAAKVSASEKPSLKLGEISLRLGFIVTADFLESLGFTATVERNARLYRESDFPRICAAIVRHVRSVAEPAVA